jgi:hypothetical protein
VLLREDLDLVDQLAVLPVQAHLIEQEAHAALRPDRGHEVLAFAIFGEARVEREDAFGISAATVQADRVVAGLLVAAGHDELLAKEEIRQPAWRHAIPLDLRALELQVAQDRVRDLVEERADLDLDVLLRSHVVARAACLFAERIDQEGVHVVADAEGEDARFVCVGLLDGREDLLGLLDANARETVGQKDQHRHVALLGLGRQGRSERIVDIGAAVGAEPIDELLGILAHLCVGLRERALPQPSLRGKSDDIELVLILEFGDEVAQRALGLLDLLAAH